MAVGASSQRSSALLFSMGKHKSSDGLDDGSATFSACSLRQAALQPGTKWIKVLIASTSNSQVSEHSRSI